MNEKYQIDSKENIAFLDKLNKELVEFGKKFPSPGGGAYYLGDAGEPWTDRNRETWITCRMAHVYSIAKMMGDKDAPVLARAAIEGLLNGELYDKENDGWYAGVTADGQVLPTKQCYAHAFVILAGTSAHLAEVEGAEQLLERALDVYDEYFWNEDEGLACDTWNTEFTQCDEYRGLNANMHTVEAFLAVADALCDDEYRERAGRIINHVVEWAEDNNWRIPEHFNEDWSVDKEKNSDKPDDPFKPYGATPGHGIEWARLITQWALSTYSEEAIKSANADSEASKKIKEYVNIAENLYNRAIEDGWNADGAKGIVYTTDWEGKPVVRDRMHWTIAEAVNTSAILFHITGKNEYAKNYYDFMEYIDECVLDHENGSWIHQLDENNEPKGTVWPGKSDLYHAFQATLIPYEAFDVSIASAIWNELYLD